MIYNIIIKILQDDWMNSLIDNYQQRFSFLHLYNIYTFNNSFYKLSTLK